jgi:predicted peroxiredoxin
MAKYLLVESRDPHSAGSAEQFYGMAVELARAGNEVTLFLVENGVFPARRSPFSDALQRVSQAGVEVLADEFALRERGITNARLVEWVKPAPLEVIVDQLAAGRKAIWQ